MCMQAACEVTTIDEWTERKFDGRSVSYRIMGNHTVGFIYSAATGGRSVSVLAPQGPLSRDKVESLFAESLTVSVIGN
jgi:hypothetical protein